MLIAEELREKSGVPYVCPVVKLFCAITRIIDKIIRAYIASSSLSELDLF